MLQRDLAKHYGLGAAPLGNLFAAIHEDEVEAVLDAVAALHVIHIDTAPLYGHGLSERRIGQYLATHRHSSFKLTTKVGRCLDPGEAVGSDFAEPLPLFPRFDYSRDGILRSFQDSLARLGVTKVHGLLLHDIGLRTHGESHAVIFAQAMDEALPALHELKAQGYVDVIGLGVNEWQVCADVMRTADIDVILLAGRYTLLEQDALAFLDYCLGRHIDVVIGGAFNSGLLAGGNVYDYAEAPNAMIRRRNRLADICARHGVPLAAAALQFVQAHPAVIRSVVGLRSVAEVEAFAANADRPIPAALWDAFREDGLLASEAPVPC